MILARCLLITTHQINQWNDVQQRHIIENLLAKCDALQIEEVILDLLQRMG